LTFKTSGAKTSSIAILHGGVMNEKIEQLISEIAKCSDADNLFWDIKKKVEQIKKDFQIQNGEYKVIYENFCSKANELGMNKPDHHLYGLLREDLFKLSPK